MQQGDVLQIHVVVDDATIVSRLIHDHACGWDNLGCIDQLTLNGHTRSRKRNVHDGDIGRIGCVCRHLDWENKGQNECIQYVEWPVFCSIDDHNEETRNWHRWVANYCPLHTSNSTFTTERQNRIRSWEPNCGVRCATAWIVINWARSMDAMAQITPPPILACSNKESR